jgi:hypothetical protein
MKLHKDMFSLYKLPFALVYTVNIINSLSKRVYTLISQRYLQVSKVWYCMCCRQKSSFALNIPDVLLFSKLCSISTPKSCLLIAVLQIQIWCLLELTVSKLSKFMFDSLFFVSYSMSKTFFANKRLFYLLGSYSLLTPFNLLLKLTNLNINYIIRNILKL